MHDTCDLEHFVVAQDRVYLQVCTELASGTKTSHWIWFVFPQIRGLGRSDTARRYAIASLAEARAYWLHPTLGPRLRHCTELMLAVPGKSALQILGTPDDLKFHSCMTLFAQAAPQEPAFERALQQYFGGESDTATLARL